MKFVNWGGEHALVSHTWLNSLIVEMTAVNRSIMVTGKDDCFDDVLDKLDASVNNAFTSYHAQEWV